MKKTWKRLLVMLLCVVLIGADSTMCALAAGNDFVYDKSVSQTLAEDVVEDAEEPGNEETEEPGNEETEEPGDEETEKPGDEETEEPGDEETEEPGDEETEEPGDEEDGEESEDENSEEDEDTVGEGEETENPEEAQTEEIGADDRILPAPTGVKLAIVNGELKVTWNAVKGALRYNIFFRNSADPEAEGELYQTEGTSVVIESDDYCVSDEINYFAVVGAVNEIEGEPWQGSEGVSNDFMLTNRLAASINPTKLEWDDSGEKLYKSGDTEKLSVAIAPSVAEVVAKIPGALVYSSSDENVATIDENGIITAKNAGCAEITAKFKNKTVSRFVKVYSDIESVTLEGDEEITLLVGQPVEFHCMTRPSNMPIVNFSGWSCTDETVANVSGGSAMLYITAAKPGKVTVSGTFDEKITVKKVVNVVDEIEVVWEDGSVKKVKTEFGNDYGMTLDDLTKQAKAIEDKIFIGWYTQPEGKGKSVLYDYVLDNKKVYGYWVERSDSFTVVPIGDFEYVGSAIRPLVNVYDGIYRLEEGIDYRVSYSRNINVGRATVVVQGINRYTGKVVTGFDIVPTDISNIIDSSQLGNHCFAYNKRVQKPVIATLNTYFGMKLRNRVDYDLSYPSDGDYKMPGNYTIKATAKGNYKGSVYIDMTITEKKLVSKLKVTVEKENGRDWTIKEVGEPVTPGIKVMDGRKVLEAGRDYIFEYVANTEVGTGSIFLYGLGDYDGFRRVDFKILGQPISKCVVKGIEAQESTFHMIDNPLGNQLSNIEVYTDSTESVKLEEDKDYCVWYDRNWKVGTALVYIGGIGKYSGVIRKTFRITAVDASEAIINFNDPTTVPYVKGGAIPSVQSVKCKGHMLFEGTDYTVRYINYSKCADKDSAVAPTAIITFRGNYKGQIKYKYTICKNNVDFYGTVKAAFDDVPYVKGVNRWKSNGTVTEIFSNAKLKAGLDYKLTYVYAEGEKENSEVLPNDDVKPGTKIRVLITFIGNYTCDGYVAVEYTVRQNSFARTVITVKDQVYDYYKCASGGIQPSPEDITVKIGKDIIPADQYEVIEYWNNTSVGVGKMKIRGKGDYAGTKTVTFRIKKKTF